MYLDGLNCVLRAGGLEFAAARRNHMQRRRKPALVEAEQGKQQTRHGVRFPDLGLPGTELPAAGRRRAASCRA